MILCRKRSQIVSNEREKQKVMQKEKINEIKYIIIEFKTKKTKKCSALENHSQNFFAFDLR